jgi:hypothetical protein
LIVAVTRRHNGAISLCVGLLDLSVLNEHFAIATAALPAGRQEGGLCQRAGILATPALEARLGSECLKMAEYVF